MDFLDKKHLHPKKDCPICHSNSKIIDTTKTINHNSNEILNLRECLYCKHWWIDPMPTQNYLNELYKKSSEFVVSRGYRGREEPSNKELEKYSSRFLEYIKNKKKLKYLEIGVGPGYLYNYFKNKTAICYGVDPCSYKPKDNNIVSDIKEIPDNTKFDIIVIQDVLEHLERPTSMLVKLKKLANKDALISCGFPNKDSFIAKKNKGKWRMIRPVGHIHYFSSKSIEILFKKTGWITLKKYSYWGYPSLLDIIKNFDWNFKNPLKLIYRMFFYLIIKEIILGKDQWYVLGLS